MSGLSRPKDVDSVYTDLVGLTQRPFPPVPTVSNATFHLHNISQAAGETGTHTPTFQQNMPSGHSLPPGAHIPSPAERVNQLKGIQGDMRGAERGATYMG